MERFRGDNEIAITPDGERAYIATDEVPGVAVLDINTNEIVAGIETEDTIKGIVIAPVDKRAYATDRSGVVRVLDTATNAVVTKVSEGGKKEGIAITPDGKRL